ncbi:class I SAM-dependent methyltransferase [Streptomyces hainanensis]|uniref:Class I SAM-dependent methyltransferase n=1 Tax=Streptomyces hainanensis TaxID=402648 RepID=A0A4R4TMK1_9ACTN|nr:class I SAM-dependent methyltransferase [Streptomyces hainanensis]TDC76552.1 class I SAM-dependent methyltransferase [Streptomyces hainanensis]
MSQFDDLASLYEDFSATPFRQHLEFPTVLGLVKEGPHGNVLDLGCGSGAYSRLLRGSGADRVTGLDESTGMIDHARRRERAEGLGIRYLTGELPAELHGTFDLVLAVYVLPYATTYEELLGLCRTAADALRPGGRFLTLPVHPDFHRDRDHYAPYGFRVWTDGERHDGARVRLRFRDRDVDIIARYWSAEALGRALVEAGFAAPRYREHRLSDTAAAGPVAFWEPYLTTPHAAVLDTVRV